MLCRHSLWYRDKIRCIAIAMFFNRVFAPEGELLSFAPPRQLLLRCSTSCIHAVEKKVAKEKAARLPLMSCAPRICRGTAEWASCPSAAVRHPCRTPTGYSRQMLRCSTRQTGEKRVTGQHQLFIGACPACMQFRIL